MISDYFVLFNALPSPTAWIETKNVLRCTVFELQARLTKLMYSLALTKLQADGVTACNAHIRFFECLILPIHSVHRATYGLHAFATGTPCPRTVLFLSVAVQPAPFAVIHSTP